jgi:ubiquinone/menaquinone biosynthesis C-methylase UbiE
MKTETMNSNHPGGLQLTARAAKLAGILPGMQLLDIGCGAGATLEMLAKKFGIVPFGIDISKKMINIANKRLPAARLEVCDAADLPYPNAYFDAIICECTLSIVDDAYAILNETRRTLKTDGPLIVSDVCKQDDLARITTMFAETGFELVHFENHKAALVTYVAEKHMQGITPCLEQDEALGTMSLTNCTYYLAISRRRHAILPIKKRNGKQESEQHR